MKIIKKLDIFILKNYLMLFAGTFCISLFVVMMQFLWRYVDELVGKGLTLDVLAKFFFYAGETLVPLALPLGVLLASLISFGNLGEKLELLAIKAAGISLFRTLRSLIVFNTLIMGISFYFQNNVAPKAQENLMTLMWSIRQASPEVDIPEGVFYNGVQGLNMYVKEKNKETGILYDVIIYNMRDGVNNAHIVLADSGKMETSADKTELILTLWNGEQFENISNSGLQTRNVPYRRETFVDKVFLIDFDTNFNMSDNEGIGRSADTKRMDQIVASVDSMVVYYDSMAVAFYNDMAVRLLYVQNTSRAMTVPIDSSRFFNAMPAEPDTAQKDSQEVEVVKVVKDTLNREPERYRHVRIPELAKVGKDVKYNHKNHVILDSVYSKLDNNQKQRALVAGMQHVDIVQMDIDYKALQMDDGDNQIRRHWVQFWTKITMALACLVFFFIGAPLGAIIRKGGLGMPVIIAVLIFIFYYIINTGGMRAGREGSIPVWFGMWLSTIVLAPVAVFLTVKSNNDSVVFNMDSYVKTFKKLIGKRQKRYISRKEVIINDPDYAANIELLQDIMRKCYEELKNNSRRRNPLGYLWYIIRRPDESNAIDISQRLEMLVDSLSNSKDRHVLLLLNGFPIMDPKSFRFYRRRRGDMKAILKYGDMLLMRMEDLVGDVSAALPDDLAEAVSLAEITEDDAEENY